MHLRQTTLFRAWVQYRETIQFAQNYTDARSARNMGFYRMSLISVCDAGELNCVCIFRRVDSLLLLVPLISDCAAGELNFRNSIAG